ncbi:ATP phosphoribosyltransferase [Candidatus Fermentibacterales bacterium]|nr:ATP phosphoribosyltransferase [Candidatus Fermentibacterales bacterium]
MRNANDRLRLLLPAGRIQEKVLGLLRRSGLEFGMTARSYKPVCSDPAIEAKMLKPQNIPQLVALGRHHCGFTGLDWVVEQEADVMELLDLGYDAATIVSAIPENLSLDELLGNGVAVVASEYRRIALDYIRNRGITGGVLVQAYGATEALPPDDADMIVDNTSTGTTLAMNRLKVVDEIMRTSTRFICNRQVYERDPEIRRKLDEIAMIMRSTLDAAEKRILEMNVPGENLEEVVGLLPCMRSPTVAPLYGEEGFAVKIAMPRCDVARLIPLLKAMGARDILEYNVEKIVI